MNRQTGRQTSTWTMIRAEDGFIFDLNDAENQETVKSIVKNTFKGRGGYDDDHLAGFYIELEKCLKKSYGFKDRGRILGYIRAVARFHYLTDYLSPKRRIKYEVANSIVINADSYSDYDLDAYYMDHASIDTTSPESSILIALDMQGFLSRLDDDDMPLIELMIQGHGYAETAKEMGVNANSLFTGTQRLRKRLQASWAKRYQA